uniref:G_PROTEIN_RECEP_F1_2 domain-containing protein n=1 Tax=Heterorhabditis bacteriophora TaxID=37862 RepID=A0A1I7XFU1_HETBA
MGHKITIFCSIYQRQWLSEDIAYSCSLRELVVISIIFISTGALAVHMNFSFTVTENSGIREMISTQSSELATILTVLDIMFFVVIPMVLLITLNSFLVYYLRNRRQFFESTGTFREGGIRRCTKSPDSSPPLLEQNNYRSDVLSGPSMVTRNLSSSSASVWCRQLNKAERHVTVTVVVIVSAYVITHLPSALLYANMKKLICACWRRDLYSYKDNHFLSIKLVTPLTIYHTTDSVTTKELALRTNGMNSINRRFTRGI